MSVVAQPLTWDDIKDWPEDAGRKTELVHGELIVSPSPSLNHQAVVLKLAQLLANHLEEFPSGELFSDVDVVLASDLIFRPDLCFVRNGRDEILYETKIAGAPELCIEIISESNRTHDTVVKFREYARHGISEYWLVDVRAKEISSWHNEGSSFVLIGRAVPGKHVATRLFPDLCLDAGELFTKAMKPRRLGRRRRAL